MGNGIGSASWLELVSTIAAIITSVYLGRMLHLAWLTKRYLEIHELNGSRKIVAKGQIRTKALLLGIALLLMQYGVTLCLTPPSHPHARWTVTGWAGTIAALGILTIVIIEAVSKTREYDRVAEIEHLRENGYDVHEHG